MWALLPLNNKTIAAVHESETGPKLHLAQGKDMSEVEVKADSKANTEFGRI
jgi:hypothetical protein